MSGHTWIERERLLTRIGAARVVVMSAPGGWGKTTLATQLLARRGLPVVTIRLDADTDAHAALAAVRRALRRAGHVELADLAPAAEPAEALDALLGALAQRDDRLAFHVDEAHRLDPTGATWLRSLIDDLGDGHHAVVTGRTLDRALLRRQPASWARLEIADLRFDATEVGDVLGDADDALCERVLSGTDGWPAAVGLAAHADLDVLDGSSRLVLDRLLDDILGDDRLRLAPVGLLPLLDRTTVDCVAGPGAFDLLVRSGLPMRRNGEWWMLADPLREALAGEATIDADIAAAVAARYELPTAVAMLMGFGCHAATAALLGAAHWTKLDQFGPRELDAIFAAVTDAGAAVSARLLLNAARSAELREPDQRRSWIAAGLAVAEAGSLESFELWAEQVRDAVRDAATDAFERAEVVLGALPPNARIARARALLVKGIGHAYRATPEQLADADRAFNEAAAITQVEGETRWQAEVLSRLAFNVSYHGGRIARAAEQQAAALALLPSGSRDWALGMSYYSEILDTLGRSGEAEAAARECFDYGQRLGDAIAIGYGAWSLAVVFAHRNDVEATRRWLDEAERSPGNWSGEVIGQEFLAFGSDLLGGLGEREAAASYRERCAARVGNGGTQGLVDVLDGRLEAMYGDPERAIELFERLEGEPYATVRTRWVRYLFRALAAQRLGRRSEATGFVAQAIETCERMGLPDLPFRLESTLVTMLAGVWPGGAQADATARIVTLGGFSVVRGAEIVTPAPGHPATLVKLLALRGALTADQVIDQLWPDADVSTGRARLRNLLNRVRGQAGELVTRNGEVLALLPDVATDVARFEQLVEAAFAAAESERAGQARVAMAAYGGELLPGDTYEDWAAGPRERLRRRFLSLVDIVADDALARGDVDEAMRLLDMAIEHEPLEESRYVRAAKALDSSGRRSAARQMVARAAGALAEIGLEPGRELSSIGRSLDVR